MDGVFLGEADAVVSFKGVEICEEELKDGGASCVVEEEGRFCRFVDLGLAGFESAGGAGGAWFTGRRQLYYIL